MTLQNSLDNNQQTFPGDIHIYRKDCMELMKSFPDKYFDLAIVDPPYGINASTEKFTRSGTQTGKSLAVSGINYTHSDWDNAAPDESYFIELQRVSKNQIIWGANHFIDNIPNASSPCWIVWDKVTGNNLYADCELAYTSFPSAVRKFTFMWKGMFQGDMRNKEERIHPTQKPVALYKWLLEKYAKPGMRIIDTHLGSGSIAIASYDFSVSLTACELNQEYFEKACTRLDLHIKTNPSPDVINEFFV